jgi:predicted amidohydrolase YtcJ
MCYACNPGAAVALRESTRRDFLKGTAAFAALSAVGAGSAAAEGVTGGAADAIFHNGPIHTMADETVRVEAIAIRAGRISAIGSTGDVEAQQGPNTRMIDLGGHTLLPGLIDPHVHTSLTMLDAWLDLGPVRNASIAAALAVLRSEVAKTRPGEWIRGQQLDPSLMAGEPVTRRVLDAIAPANPVFILESNGHVAYANSAAFAAVGMTRDTPDPPKGRFLRGPDGELTGRMEEGAAYLRFFARMPMPTPEEMAAGMRRMFDRAASVGCTALHDCGVGTRGLLDQIAGVVQGDPPVRLGGFLTSDGMKTWTDMGLKPGTGSDRFRLTGIKFWADGSNQARTGYLREPYLGSTGRGMLNDSVEHLTEGIRQAHDLGWQVAVHANGDAAIDTVLDAYDAVLKVSPRADHRHRIEHCSLLRPENIQRMAALGVSPSFLIGHVHFWGRAFRDRILGPDRVQFYDPCASALAGGLRVSLHSDYNVTPIEPLRCADNAVNRVMRDGGDVFGAHERITPAQAMRAVTIDAAWQCRMDHMTGSLEVGKYADLVVLDRDPMAGDPAAIGSIKVVETWLEGKSRYAA